MSDRFDNKYYDTLFGNLVKATKRVTVSKSPGRKLTTDAGKLDEYKQSIVETYNEFVKYANKFYSRFDEPSQKIIRERLRTARSKVDESFAILTFEYTWTNNLVEQILIDKIEIDQQPSTSTEKESVVGQNKQTVIDSTDTTSDEEVGEETEDRFDQSELSFKEAEGQSDDLNEVDTPLDDNVSESEDGTRQQQVPNNNNAFDPPEFLDNTIIMPQTAADFMKLAASIMNHKFDGDSTKLESFLSEIELVDNLAELNNKTLCIKFVKSRLEGKALECLPDTIESMDDITNALKAEIKAESSSVIEGKILSLRVQKGNFSKFSEEAEKLAENLRRSLVVEGMSKAKAREITIKKTVELCRKTARSDVVKSVVSSAHFDTPAEAIAKLITESTIARNENTEAKNFQQKRSRGQFSNRGRQFSRNRPQGNQSGSSFRGGFGGNNRGGGFQNRQNNFRGRGQTENRRNDGNRRFSNRPEHTIRLVTGNPMGPSSGGNQQSEPTYHIPL